MAGGATQLDAVLARWTLVQPVRIAETPRSLIYRVTRTGGEVAALKLLKAEAKGDEARGGALLAWYDGGHAARVFATSDDAVLMQWLAGETLGEVARGGGDAEASAILSDVVEGLHAPRSGPPPELLPLDQWFAALFATPVTAWPADARALVVRATEMARALLATMPMQQPLHGDIHHDNILRCGADWLAIDPKGLVGDPAYDYANSFQNPFGAADLVCDADRIMRHVATLAQKSRIARRHLLAWAVAHTALSGAWNIADGIDPAHQVTMLDLLVPLHAAAGES